VSRLTSLVFAAFAVAGGACAARPIVEGTSPATSQGSVSNRPPQSATARLRSRCSPPSEAVSGERSYVIGSVALRPEPLTTIADSVDFRMRQRIRQDVYAACAGTDNPEVVSAKTLNAAIKRVQRDDTLSVSAVSDLRDLRALLGAPPLTAPLTPRDLATYESSMGDISVKFAAARDDSLKMAIAEQAVRIGKVSNLLETKLQEKQILHKGKPAPSDSSLLELAREMCVSPEDVSPLTVVGADVLQGFGWEASSVEGSSSSGDSRITTESSLLFYERFERKLCSPEGKQLMPETCCLAESARSAQQIPVVLLRSTVDADLVSLPFGIVASHEDVLAISVLRALLMRVRRGDSPVMLLAGMGAADALQSACSARDKELSCVLRNLGKLTGISADATGIRRSSAGAVAFERELDGIVRELSAAKANNVCEGDAACFVPEKATDDDLKAFFRALNHLQGVTAQSAQSSGTKDRLQQAGDVLFALYDTLEAGINLYAPAYVLSADTPHEFETKVFSSWQVVGPAFEAASSALRGAYGDSVRQTMAIAPNPDIPNDLAARLEASLNYLPLLADIGAAKSASDVRLAIDNAAEPLVSYRSKQDHVVVSVTTLAGASIGYEFPISAGKRSSQPYGGLLGVTGVDLGFPIKGGFNGGAMISLLDIGSALSSPITAQATPIGSSGAVASKAKSGGDFDVGELLCPGLYLHLGLPSSPFTLGAGIYFAPLGRQYVDYDTVTGATIQTARISMVRMQFVLAADFTLLPLR
jgi:hypothetical protein